MSRVKMKFDHIACGGTFDLLHKGHRYFLEEAFSLSNFVSIGLVSDSFSKQLDKSNFQNYSQRKYNIELFLAREKFLKRSRIIKLDDIYGTTIRDKTLDGIMVTHDSQSGAKRINIDRIKAGLAPLKIVKCRVLTDGDGKVISSSRIKAGIISPNGLVYHKYLTANNYTLPNKLRVKLGKPFGKVYKNLNEVDCSGAAVSVGDEITKQFLSIGVIPKISIIDYKVQRVRRFKSPKDIGFRKKIRTLNVVNNPGVISREMSLSVQTCWSYVDKSLIVVEGEEDLAVIPVVLTAPLGANVYYGLRKCGFVDVLVNLEIKERFLDLLKNFPVI